MTARQVVGGTIIVVAPTLLAITQARSSPARDRLELFSLGWSDLIPLVFPLLISVVFLPRLADELANGGTRALRTRIPLGRFLATRTAQVAVIAFACFAIAVFVSWLLAFSATAGQLDALISAPERGETYSDPSQRHRFTGLLDVHPVAFGVFYAGWVGINAAAYTTLGVAALVWVQNRFAALAVPFVAYLIISVGSAVSGHASFGSSTAIFPFSLVQVPVWQAMPQLVLVAGAAVAALIAASWQQYETPGLD